MFRLGPFDVETPIGKGGMGVIYRASHRGRRVPVALKVDLHPPGAEVAAAFLHEVNAIGGLDHPHIVMVLDHGEVDATASRDSQGKVREGSRWLAMELAGGGSVKENRPTRWAEVRHVMVGLLEALRHAHARGVIHRDIKPGNLLLAGSRAETASRPATLLEARVMLSDFGVSHHAFGAGEHSEESIGTPYYMAPEQIKGDWRSQGPWTDLYAAGILLWRLVTGKFPFVGRNSFQVLRQHMMAPPGPFVPAMATPPGLEPFVRQLLEKACGARPPFASDALATLLDLGEPRGAESETSSTGSEAEFEDLATEPVTGFTGPGGAVRALVAGPRLRSGVAAGPRNFQLEGAGLSFYGTRPIPMVGRHQERALLLAELDAVEREGRARAVWIRGPSGTGKSRLAQWLSHRAHESGAAITARCVHGNEADEDALLTMLADHLHTPGEAADVVDERLRDKFGGVADIDVAFLSHLVGGTRIPNRRASAQEVRLLVARVLETLAGDRSLVLWLDDLQWGLSTLEWVDFFLAFQTVRPSRVLIVGTIEETALDGEAEVIDLLDELASDPALTSVNLGPLPAEEHRSLVRELLGLDGALAQSVEERTHGNPMFAVQLVGQWVERGLLEATANGFRLRPGVDADLPEDVRAVWERRLEEALKDVSIAEREVVEVAAVLGVEVVEADWRAVCELLEIPTPDAMLAQWIRRRLLWAEDEDPGRWFFAHGLLREALIRQSRAAGRWADQNLAAAVHWGQSKKDEPRRLARYFVEGGALEEALEPLLEAASDQLDSGDLRSEALIKQLEEVLGRLAMPESDPMWGRALLLRSWRARKRDEVELARRAAGKAERQARKFGWDVELARALRESGRIAHLVADYPLARELFEAAESQFLSLGDTIRAADCRYSLGRLLAAVGTQEEARAMFASCAEPFRDPAAWPYAHYPLLGMALSLSREGKHQEMGPYLQEARRRASRHGFLEVAASAANLEGEAARASGDLELAANLYQEAANHYRAMANPEALVPLLNLGIIRLDRAQFSLAAETMQPLLEECQRTQRPAFAAFAEMILMSARAGLAHWEEATEHFRNLVEFNTRTGGFDLDMAAEFSRTAALAKGQPLAREARAQAATHYTGLGMPERAQSLGEEPG